MRLRDDDALWNGEQGAGGISWADRSRMGPLRGVIDAGDASGRRNAYMHALHVTVLQRELERAGPLKKILDFGCGTGRFIKLLSEYAPYVAAADKEASMVDAACLYAGSSAAEIVCCDPSMLPFDSSAFDFVLCSSVLCVTMKDSLPQIVCELGRVTRTGGTLLLLEQVSDQRDLPLSRYRDALSHAGFEVMRAYPMRSGSSLLTQFAARNAWVPASVYAQLAKVELALTAHARTPGRSSYMEFAIVARR
jgi:ubiquinone/menaquinone biosynthesis C-methylase UbiE